MTFEKDRQIACPAILGWVRRQRCIACVELEMEREGPTHFPRTKPGAEAHHFPPKQMGGARLRDDWTIPLCRRHHEQAQTYEIPRETQRRWLNETRARFLDEASPAELEAYFRELIDERSFPPECPF